MIFAWISDKVRHRAAFIATGAIMGIIGLTMTGFVVQPDLRYTGRCSVQPKLSI